jgi:hypothetical protein
MAQLVTRNDLALSTHRLVKAIRVFTDEDEATVLALLHTETSARPEYDLATDSSGRSSVLLTKDGFRTVAEQLKHQNVAYEEVEVRPMSELPAQQQDRARGWAK